MYFANKQTKKQYGPEKSSYKEDTRGWSGLTSTGALFMANVLVSHGYAAVRTGGVRNRHPRDGGRAGGLKVERFHLRPPAAGPSGAPERRSLGLFPDTR